MKTIALLVVTLISANSFANQVSLREEFKNSRPATFKDIQNVVPGTPHDHLFSSLKCPERNLELIKLSSNNYYDARSVVSNFTINEFNNELVGTDDLSEKTKVIRISKRGTALIEFSSFRTRRDEREGISKSVVFPDLTAINYIECSL